MEDRIAPALVKSSGLAQSSKVSQVLWTHLFSFRETGFLLNTIFVLSLILQQKFKCWYCKGFYF